MSTFIVLLRGVTPTGKNRVPMAQLRQFLSEDKAFENVETWIQSGNVILDSELPAMAIAEKVNTIIKENIGADLKIIVKTPVEIQTVLANNQLRELRAAKGLVSVVQHFIVSNDLHAGRQSADFKECHKGIEALIGQCLDQAGRCKPGRV